jgi:exodeoxyribonuclease V gamma subunit
MPVDMNALEEWTVGDRMLDDMLHDVEPADARDAEWRRGTLPPGRLGWRKATEICEQAALLADAARAYRGPMAEAVDVDIDLGGRRLTGTVSPVYGNQLVAVRYSKTDGRHLLQSWIPLLALTAHDPSRDWAAICIGRERRGTIPRVDTLRRPDAPAVELLADLVAMYDAGRREPLPLPPKTSFAWADARHRNRDPEQAARYKWATNRYPGEDQDPAQERTWGKGAWLKVLIDAGLPDYASRLWLPMLRALG